jgi:predicted nucleotidyltransferase
MRLDEPTLERLRAFFATQPVLKAYLFGSFARGEADEKSDVDIMVDLDHSRPIGLHYFGIIADLEDLLGRPVDMVTEEGLDRRVLPYVKKDLQLIYARPAG